MYKPSYDGGIDTLVFLEVCNVLDTSAPCEPRFRGWRKFSNRLFGADGGPNAFVLIQK